MKDFRFTNHGSIILVEPLTDTAKQWTDEELDIPCWAWLGQAFGCDHRQSFSLLEHIIESGFTVEGV